MIAKVLGITQQAVSYHYHLVSYSCSNWLPFQREFELSKHIGCVTKAVGFFERKND